MNKSEIAERGKFEKFMRDTASKQFPSYRSVNGFVFTSSNSGLLWACWERVIVESQTDTVEYWKSRAETAELKVLTFHEKIVELGDGEPSPEPDDCDWPKQYVVPCPGCGHSMSYLPSDGYAWRCGNKKCRFSESGAAQEVSPPSPVDDQDLEGFIPEEPPCSRPECKAMRGDTRELKAALQCERELRMKIVEFVNDTWLKDRPDIEDDGSGGGAVNPCWQCGLRLMEVVRPGKAQCSLCG